MPPHLHPRSRSTLSLFAATLGVSFVVVGLPHLFPCPAPRRTFADSADPSTTMMTTADGQQVQRIRRKRRKDPNQDTILDPVTSTTAATTPSHSSTSTPTSPPNADEEVSTFLQMEEEAQRLAKVGRECPVPKPGGRIGEWLGFKSGGVAKQQPPQQQQQLSPRSRPEGGGPSDTAINKRKEER